MCLSILATACSDSSGDAVTTLPDQTLSTEAGASPPSSTTTVAQGSTSTSAASLPPVAWIAPSGVVLAVVDANEGIVDVLTPCGDSATLAGGTPVHTVDVLLDPGHGGPIDTGAVGPNGLAEKEVNLDVSIRAAELLNERGLSTLLTRTGDYPIPIRTRAEYADRMGVRALVSIHHNAPVAPASDIPGVEIFIQMETPDSARLGGILFEETMSALAQFDIDWDRSPDAGVMTVLNPDGLDAYGMVRLPESTSVLIELGYVANRAEAELFATTGYVEAAAMAVADGVERFLSTSDPGSGFTEGRVFRPNRGVGRDQCIEPDLEGALYPTIADVDVVVEGPDTYRFDVTVSSPYDSPERYADAWRIIGHDGTVYGERILLHDHANEQPFTRSLAGVAISAEVESVIVEGRDLVYGWGGRTIEVVLP